MTTFQKYSTKSEADRKSFDGHSTQSTNKQTESDYPHLWIDNTILSVYFIGLFNVHSFDSPVPQGGTHYILAEPGQREEITKAIAWKIQKAGGKVYVHGLNQFLENLISDTTTARELTIQIFEFALRFPDWAERREEYSLFPSQATEIAKAAIALLQGCDRATELASLRNRSRISAKEWSEIVEGIEREFQEELIRRGIADKRSPQLSDEDEKLKLSLLALLKEEDPILKVRKRSLICQHYGLSKGEVNQLLRILDNRTKQKDIKVFDFEELFNLELEGLSWLIPELLPKGETVICAGSPKAGKTLLAIDAAFAIATGESGFLGQTVTQGKVLLVSCDESLRSTRNKLIKRGFRPQDKDNIRILPEWTIDQLQLLEMQLEDFRPDVVIIDSLKRITHGSQISENSAEFADNIYSLKETIGRYGASGILIHHANKSSEAMGVGKLRGSSAIAGAVWGTWQLDHIPKQDPNNKKKLIIDPSDPRRILSVFARDTEGQNLQIELNPENNSWERIDKEQDEEQCSLQQRIIKILDLNPKGLSGKQIQECLGEVGNKYIYTLLNRMTNKKLVSVKPASNDKRINIYLLPKTKKVDSHQHTSPPPTECDQMMTNSFESIDIQGKTNSHQNSHHIDEISHQLETENNLMTNQNPDSEDNSEIVIISPEKIGGGRSENFTTEKSEVAENTQLVVEPQTEQIDEDTKVELTIQHIDFQLQVGDRIRCYPTHDHASNDWKVKATITDLQTEIQNGKRWMTSMSVTWTYKGDRKTASLGGGNVDWILKKL